MDQGDIIDKMIKQVAQSDNQMFLKTSTGNSVGTLTQNYPPYDNVANVQLYVQGPWSIAVSNPTSFPLHVNQIST